MSSFAQSCRRAVRRLGLAGVVVSSVATFAALQVTEGGASAVVAPKHTICHRTHSTSNPYRRITVSANSIFKKVADVITPDFDNGASAKHPNAHSEYPFDDLDDQPKNGVLSLAELTDSNPGEANAFTEAELAATADVDGDDPGDDSLLNSSDDDFFGVGTVTDRDIDGNITEVFLITDVTPQLDNVFRVDADYPANQKKWGDIIPPLEAGGDELNYGEEGDPGFEIFNDTSVDSPCKRMSAIDYLHAECDDWADRSTDVVPFNSIEDCLDVALDEMSDPVSEDDRELFDKTNGFENLRNKDLDEIDGEIELAEDLVPGAVTDDSNFPCVVTGDEGARVVSFRGSALTNGQELFVFVQWGESASLPDPRATSANLVNVAIPVQLLDMESYDYSGLSTFDSGGAEDPVAFVTEEFSPVGSMTRTNLFFRTVVVYEVEDIEDEGTFVSTWYFGDTERCRLNRGGGGGGDTQPPTTSPSTTVSPETTAPPAPLNNPPANPNRGPNNQNNGPNDITRRLNLDPTPNPNDPSKGGTITITNDPQLPPPQVTECEIDNPDYTCEIQYSGPQYNNPQTWQDQGYGDECWKIDPGGYNYVLPDPPQPPSGRTGGTYSLVVVKAGSLTSTDPNFQVNTLFYSPAGGTAVWPDSNKDGIYNPGGRNGDKQISHIIFCVNYGGGSTATTAAVTTSPTTAAPGTSSTTTTTVAAASSTTTTTPRNTTTTRPGSTTTTTPRTTTTTVAPGSSTTTTTTTVAAANSTTTTTRAPGGGGGGGGPTPPIVINIVPKGGVVNPQPDLANLTIGVTTGTDEEVLIVPIDLTNFIFKNALPQLPVTGADPNTTRNMALVFLVSGFLLYAVRRRLFVKI